MKKLILMLFTCAVSPAFAADPGVTDKEIVIGAHTLESGAFAMYGTISQAMSAYFDMINEKGGVDGRKIKYIRIDTRGDFAKASEAAHKLVEKDKVFAVVGPIGSFHQASYKYLVEQKVPDMWTNDGASFYTTNPPNKFVWAATYSFYEEGKVLGKYITDKFPGKKVCFLLSASVQGEELTKAITESVEAHNKKATGSNKMTLGQIETVDRAAVQADSEVSKLKAAKCEVIATSTTGTLAAKMINYGNRISFKPQWVSYRYNANDKFLSLIDEAARDGILATTAVTTGENLTVPGWADYKKLMEKNNLPVTGLTAQGHMMAELFVETLRRANKMGPLTRENYLKAAATFKDWKCQVCVGTLNTSETNQWAASPVLVVTKGGQWTLVQ